MSKEFESTGLPPIVTNFRRYVNSALLPADNAVEASSNSRRVCPAREL